jgi:hypothetical protein
MQALGLGIEAIAIVNCDGCKFILTDELSYVWVESGVDQNSFGIAFIIIDRWHGINSFGPDAALPLRWDGLSGPESISPLTELEDRESICVDFVGIISIWMFHKAMSPSIRP